MPCTLQVLSDFFKILFMCLFLAFIASGGLSLVVASGRYSLVAVFGLLFVVASLVGELRLSGTRASVVAALGL